MYFSIATVCLSGTLETKIDAISRAGFGFIEIFENDLVTSRNSPDTIASMISDAGLRTVVYQPFRDFEGLSGNLRVKAFDRAERITHLAVAHSLRVAQLLESTLLQ